MKRWAALVGWSGVAFVAVALFASAPRPADAEASGDGTELLQKARGLARTEWDWEDRRQVLRLTIVDERGNERVRTLMMFTRREDGGGEKSLAVFLEPADVRGTGFLQHAPKTGASTQWLFLPELGRVRQISSTAHRKSFMGTDFSYADLGLIENALLWTDDEASAQRLKRPDADADRAWFELRQQTHDPPYDHLRVELTEADAVLRSMEMVEADGRTEKVLRFEDIRTIKGVPSAFRMEMSQPDRNTRTTVAVSDLSYDSGIPNEVFTKRALERGLSYVE